jgi:hypothetical protein
MKKQLLAILGAVLLDLMVPTASKALVFTFSFTNATGTVDGTVTGQIFGLPVNGTNVAATDVILYGYPSGLGLPTAPLDVFTGASVTLNSFDVAGGQIVTGYFESTFAGGSSLNLWPLHWDAVLQGPTGSTVISTGAATYALIPEPSTWAMMLLGFAGLGFVGYRKSRRPAARAA